MLDFARIKTNTAVVNCAMNIFNLIRKKNQRKIFSLHAYVYFYFYFSLVKMSLIGVSFVFFYRPHSLSFADNSL